MQREIKFRAWDKEKKEWVGPFLIDGGDGTLLDSQANDYHPNWQLMQFTGLKDKNDKEIYEGDILVIGENREEPLTVYFHAGFYRARFEKDNLTVDFAATAFNGEDASRVEIIGNIYENPAL